jgi:hypothetical protein
VAVVPCGKSSVAWRVPSASVITLPLATCIGVAAPARGAPGADGRSLPAARGRGPGRAAAY